MYASELQVLRQTHEGGRGGVPTSTTSKGKRPKDKRGQGQGRSVAGGGFASESEHQQWREVRNGVGGEGGF